MPTDRVYHDIVRELRMGKLHDVVFEKIAVRIANHFGVRVLPMPGGLDEGYDGAIVDADGGRLPGPLVATIQADGLANLRKNLRMHSSTYPDAAKRAFFATTQPKTNRQRRNLTQEAQVVRALWEELGLGETLVYTPSDLTTCHAGDAFVSTNTTEKYRCRDVRSSFAATTREPVLQRWGVAPRSDGGQWSPSSDSSRDDCCRSAVDTH